MVELILLIAIALIGVVFLALHLGDRLKVGAIDLETASEPFVPFEMTLGKMGDRIGACEQELKELRAQAARNTNEVRGVAGRIGGIVRKEKKEQAEAVENEVAGVVGYDSAPPDLDQVEALRRRLRR